MNVGTNGIVVDQQGNVLLIKRNDTRTYAPPGGGVDAGELPSEAAAREVREETGLIVMPVRLAALTFLPLGSEGYLGFTFRCLLRGGDMTTSEESPLVGFFKTNPLPRRMSSFHRERVAKALVHAEERPLFFQNTVSTFNNAARFVLRHLVYRWLDVKRKLQGRPPYEPPPPWHIYTYLLLKNEDGATLWHKPAADAPWQLPGGKTDGMTPPWETAVQLAQQQTGRQLQPQHLTDVFLGPADTQLHLLFTATAVQSPPSTKTLRWIQPDNHAIEGLALQQQMVSKASNNLQPTQFHKLENNKQ